LTRFVTVPQDETFTGSLCLITMDPESHFLLLEQLALARDQTSWHAWMELALAQCNCRVIQATSDEAPGLLADVEHYLEAHHAPDLFHVQHELIKAVSAPLATKERAALQAVTEATAQLDRLHSDLQRPSDERAKRHPGRAPNVPMRLEHAEQVLEAARREHERLAEHRAQVKASIRGIGHAYHCVDLERGVRRNGQLIAADIQAHIDVSTLFRTQNLIGFQGLLIGQRSEIAIRRMAPLTVIKHFDIFKYCGLGLLVRVKVLQIDHFGL
jgi:hypothetical protein